VVGHLLYGISVEEYANILPFKGIANNPHASRQPVSLVGIILCVHLDLDSLDPISDHQTCMGRVELGRFLGEVVHVDHVDKLGVIFNVGVGDRLGTVVPTLGVVKIKLDPRTTVCLCPAGVAVLVRIVLVDLVAPDVQIGRFLSPVHDDSEAASLEDRRKGNKYLGTACVAFGDVTVNQQVRGVPDIALGQRLHHVVAVTGDGDVDDACSVGALVGGDRAEIVSIGDAERDDGVGDELIPHSFPSGDLDTG